MLVEGVEEGSMDLLARWTVECERVVAS